MKIPETVKIGGRIYEVMYPYKFEDSPQVLNGLHDGARQTIKISAIDAHGAERCGQAIQHTFLHEILHAISMVYGGGLNSNEDCENIIDQMAEGLLQVIKDNDLDFRT